jgi:hypothetical protein
MTGFKSKRQMAQQEAGCTIVGFSERKQHMKVNKAHIVVQLDILQACIADLQNKYEWLLTRLAPEKTIDDKDVYFTDTVYASFDGHHIWLAANHHENKVVALDPSMFARLCKYAEMCKVKST